MHNLVVAIGYKKIVTEMGTKHGEKLFNKRFGYINEPQYHNQNRWVKEFSWDYSKLLY